LEKQLFHRFQIHKQNSNGDHEHDQLTALIDTLYQYPPQEILYFYSKKFFGEKFW